MNEFLFQTGEREGERRRHTARQGPGVSAQAEGEGSFSTYTAPLPRPRNLSSLSAVSLSFTLAPFLYPGTMWRLYFQDPRGAAGFLTVSGLAALFVQVWAGDSRPGVLSWR